MRPIFILLTACLVAVVIGMIRLAGTDMGPGNESTQTSVPPIPRIELPQLSVDDFGIAIPSSIVTERLRRNETLSGLMARLDVDTRQAHAAITALTGDNLIDARRIQRGQAITVYRDADRLLGLSMQTEPGRHVMVKRQPDNTYRARALSARLSATIQSAQGHIVNSLYETAISAGVSDQTIVDFAGIFAFDVDFQREIHPSDHFEMVYETLVDERGRVIRRGRLLFAALIGRDVQKRYYYFMPSDDGQADYFQANGESATRFLMKTPINGARLSSRFGKRRHPISGYTRLHKGTDFAAPTGTPIYAAGHGTIERASRYGGYGHYVRIRHANGYKTAYAHLSRYARGMRKGKRVRQGDIIGYVGSTGASTGPHLHYEVYQNGRAIDVMRLNLPTGRKLAETPAIMADFVTTRDLVDEFRTASEPGTEGAKPVAPAPAP